MSETPGGNRPCRAKRSDGEPCKGRALIGGTVCWYHGGKATPKATRESRKVLVGAGHLTNTLGTPVEIAPANAMLEEVWRTQGHVLWLQEKILTSDPDRLIENLWRAAHNTDGGAPTEWRQEARDVAPEAYSAVYYDLYMKERKHLLEAADKTMRAGVAERFVQLAEAQGVALSMALMRIMDALQLSAEQTSIAQRVIPQELRALTAASTEDEAVVVD